MQYEFADAWATLACDLRGMNTMRHGTGRRTDEPNLHGHFLVPSVSKPPDRSGRIDYEISATEIFHMRNG
jgi:hypothetical protein